VKWTRVRDAPQPYSNATSTAALGAPSTHDAPAARLTHRKLRFDRTEAGPVLLAVGPYFAVKGLNFFRYFAGKGAKFR
jgi:hypothetical protein